MKKSYFDWWIHLKCLIWSLYWPPLSSHQPSMAPWKHLCYGTWHCIVIVWLLAISIIRLGDFFKAETVTYSTLFLEQSSLWPIVQDQQICLTWMNKNILMKEGINKWVGLGKKLSSLRKIPSPSDFCSPIKWRDWTSLWLRSFSIQTFHDSWLKMRVRTYAFYDLQKAMLGRK